MSGVTYFDLLPTVSYDVDGNGPIVVTDVTRRFVVRQLVSGGATVMYDYVVKDGERPDTVAFKYYGDSELDWLIMLANDIHDRYYGWPLDGASFDAYLRDRYGSVSEAMGRVHHYELTLQKRTVTNLPDGTTVVEPERSLVIDAATYMMTAPDNRRRVDCYTHETELNDARRRIRLIDKRHVPAILARVQEIYEH